MKQEDVARLTALFQAGRLQEAQQDAERLRRLNPQVPFLYNMLGAIHGRLGQHKAALGYYNVAIQLKPDFGEAHSNLGVSLAALGKLQEALTSHRRAVGLNPGSASAQLNLGGVLAQLRYYDEAADCFRKAALADPRSAKAQLNLGIALMESGRLSQAIECLDRSLELQPDSAEAHHYRGLSLKSLGEFEASIGCFERALECRPDYGEALSSLIFVLGYLGSTAPGVLRARSEAYGALVAGQVAPFAQNLPREGSLEHLGFMSADFGLHPVGHFTRAFLEALLPALAARNISVTLYSNRSEGRQDRLTREFKSLPCRWCDICTLSDRELISQVRGDGVDILVDLSGHTAGNRLKALAARCAPLQVTWLGYFATTGLATMDYILGDAHVTPTADAHHFVERIATLPNSYLCFTPPGSELEPGALPAIETGSVTFGCLNNLSKMGPEVAALWSRVLKAVPGSRLLLKSPQLDERTAADKVRSRFADLGIAAERLELRGASDRDAHLATYRDIDIALDPFPYPGGTTSCEAYWMGVPVVSLAGFHFLSRVGESIARTVGLDDWLAQDAEEYIAKATAAAADLRTLAATRASLRQQLLASPLCDAGRFAEDFIDTLDSLWEAET